MIEATLRCVARFGLSKTTVDDVAREARTSRATVYRVFPGGRDEIVAATVSAEIERFFTELGRCLEATDCLEDRLVAAMTCGAEQLARHQALAFVLAHEPELVLPRVSFGGLDDVLALTGGFLQPYLADWLEPEDARRVGEWLTRLVVSHVVCPTGAVDGLSLPGPSGASFRGGAGTAAAIRPVPLSEEQARRTVTTFVIPGIAVLNDARAGTSPDQAPAQARAGTSPAHTAPS